MLAHLRPNALPPSRSRHHITAVTYVRSQTGLIGLKVISAEYLTLLLGDISHLGQLNPEVVSFFSIGLRVVGIGFARCNDWLKNLPDLLKIRGLSFSNVWARQNLVSQLYKSLWVCRSIAILAATIPKREPPRSRLSPSNLRC